MTRSIVPLATVDPASVESLLDRAFGLDRHLRTAYRVRAGTAPIAGLSFAARGEAGALVGTIQCWPVELRTSDRAYPLVMVGPVAVDPHWQQRGLGQTLMRHMIDRAERCDVPGADALMLIGDRDYYGRFFGFSADRTGEWRLPGPFDRDRLLARGDQVPALAGDIGARFVPTHLPTLASMP